MNTQVRFLLAMALMIAVLVGTNMLFPPVQPDPLAESDSVAAPVADDPTSDVASGQVGAIPGLPAQPAEGEPGSGGLPGADEQQVDAVGAEQPAGVQGQEQADAPVVPSAAVRDVVVEGPLYRYRLSTRGAVATSVELLAFQSFQADGPAQLVPEAGVPMFGNRVLVGRDTLDLRDVNFATSAPDGGVILQAGGPSESVTFTYTHPSQPFSFEVTYTFDPDDYVIGVRGRMTRLESAVLITDLGSGIGFNEARVRDEVPMLAYVTRNANEEIRAERLSKADEVEIVEGPFEWVSFKSKFFVAAALAAQSELETDVFGGLIVGEYAIPDQSSVAFTQVFSQDGAFDYRAYLGPQERERLIAVGSQLHEVNPYGWRFMRPIIRPFTGIIVYILHYLHDALGWGYGWVLMVFGVMMRVVLFPLHMKAMRAQLKNMAVQPRLKEIQTKYKAEPERLQQEMVKLYKEEGFNPLAGCLPMLLPWPVLVALFFVFQNSIQFRGVEFLWLPDLSAPDPLYLLPVFLGLSMFFLQWVSIRSIEEPNPQLKAMMWIMPIFMGFLFMQFASGLNLYYSVANVASLPQQIWVAQERKRATAKRGKSGGSGAKSEEGGTEKAGKGQKAGKG